MNIALRILNALFPPKCPVCGTLTEGNTARLCPSCAEALQEETSLLCPVCGCTAEQCLCVPPELTAHGSPLGGRTHISVGFYLPGQRDRVFSRLIYALKERSGDAPAQILSRMLARPLMRLLLEAGEDPREWILVYPPRSSAKKAEAGFDHAQRLTLLLGKATGAKPESVFRRRGGQQQKTLSGEQRQENIRQTLTLRHPEKCRGRKILLIDDVLTSGATLAHCAALLRQAEAEAVVCATVLKTLPRKTRKTSEKTGNFWFEE